MVTVQDRQATNGLPKARGPQDGLWVHPIGEEVIVYDLTQHRARSLNGAAATVWRWCDGQTTPEQMTQRLQADSQLPAEEAAALVSFALNRLDKARLLEPGSGRNEQPSVTRREMLRRLKTAGVALTLPVILTLSAPTAAMAQTGGQFCDCGVCSGVQGANKWACSLGSGLCVCASSRNNCLSQGGVPIQRCT